MCFKCKPFLKLFAFIDNKVHALIASLIFFSPVVNSFNDISMKSVSILQGDCNIKKPAGNAIINIIKPFLTELCTVRRYDSSLARKKHKLWGRFLLQNHRSLTRFGWRKQLLPEHFIEYFWFE